MKDMATTTHTPGAGVFVDRMRRAMLDMCLDDGESVEEVAEKLGINFETLLHDLRALERRPDGSKCRDKANRGRRARNKKRRYVVNEMRDRRRIVEGIVPTGDIGRLAPADAKGTIHPRTVKTWRYEDGDAILKGGEMNAKIGGVVTKGRLRGARIYTLTLEERKTCPTSCAMWRSCYGNSMEKVTRWRLTPDFCRALAGSIRALCDLHGTILIRLHVLGDFANEAYVGFWHEMIEENPGLHVFGFTAHKPKTKMGLAIGAIREAFPGRFMIRHSGTGGPWGADVIDWPTTKQTIAGATVCPEQRDSIDAPQKATHCGSCGLCWAGDTPIAFIQH